MQQETRKRSAEDAAECTKYKKNKKTREWLDQVIEKNSKQQAVYNAAAGEVKRQYFELEQAKSGKEKNEELDAALDLYHRTLHKVQICQAVDALLRFMKIYASGLTCVAHIKVGAEQIHHHIFRSLINRDYDEVEIDDYLDSLMERTTLNSFLDNVKFCPANAASVHIFDDRTFVDFFPPWSRGTKEIPESARKRLSCKNENYFPFFNTACDMKKCKDIFLISNSLKV